MPKNILFALLVLTAAAAATPPARAAAPAVTAGRESAVQQRFDATIAASKAAMMSEPDVALARAKDAIHLAYGLPAPEAPLAVASGQWLAGEALTRLNQPDAARPMIEAALKTVETAAPSTKLHADLLRSRAALASLDGKVQQSLEGMHQAYRIYAALGEARSQSIMLQNIASLYQDARDFPRALNYLGQAEDVYSQDPALSLALHNNRGNAYRDMGEHARAEGEFRKALIEARAMQSPLLEARIISNIAATQLDQGQLTKAAATIDQGLAIRASAAAEWRPFLWGLKARLADRRGDQAQALVMLGRTFAGVDLAQSTMPFRDFHELAWKVFARAGRSDEALLHLEAFKRLDDDAREVAVSTNAALMGARFDAANQELRITRLKAERAQRDLELARSTQRLHNVLLIAGLAGLAAVSVIGAVGFAFLASRRSRDRISAANAELEHAARHDHLTGLGNRAYFRECLGQELATATPSCSVMLVDLDRFKLVNDTFGHNAGDELLRQIAGRLRKLCSGQRQAFRLGGDEFAILLTDPTEDIHDFAETLIANLSQPCDLGEAWADVGATVGFAIAGEHGSELDHLVRCADLALYRAKDAGRGRVCRFEPWMQDEADEQRSLENDLRSALYDGQLSLAYQPIVRSSDDQVVAYEALLRWQHPTRGSISPTVFVPIAEEARLINEIGAWTLRQACQQATGWPETVKVAVNLSVLQLEAENLFGTVIHALAVTGLAPQRLQLEMTESVFLRHGSKLESTLTKLRDLGVSLALDDFGTGYSSLGYLQRADFAAIKIDRSFVKAATLGSAESAAIIKAIVALARGLQMECTAEGIETVAEQAAMRRLGCSQLQGFLFGRPSREQRPAEETAFAAEVHRLPVPPSGDRLPRQAKGRSPRDRLGRSSG
ncbi:hypothetical protein GCM10022281_02940 [Sphingomonas rosea]|uniref:EAL domain-containing protein n=1 Tax=Sphingomonas rosea TaxID=335605 RepID=A0ABP7TKJ9_9SPHN